MERKHFIRTLLLGAAATPALLAACTKAAETAIVPTVGGSTGTGGGSTCAVSATETEGPFPTHVPASYVRADITGGKSGYPLRLRLTVQNVNNSCAALAGALVDVWHCDADGNYSEYGGSGMQATNYQAVHFLRGRQVTDAAGLVQFTSIFPGWYSGRATHIHVHVYSASGTSLLITQIAFPEGAGSALQAVNGYGKGLSGYTTNAQDNVFRDDTAGLEIATVTGSTTAGFDLVMTIRAAA